MTPEVESHAYYNSECADYLKDLLKNRAKIRDAKPVTLPNNSETSPDVAIVKPLGKAYWIVDLNNNQLKIFKDLKQENYTTKLILTEGNISPLAFPDLVIPVQKIISIN